MRPFRRCCCIGSIGDRSVFRGGDFEGDMGISASSFLEASVSFFASSGIKRFYTTYVSACLSNLVFWSVEPRPDPSPDCENEGISNFILPQDR